MLCIKMCLFGLFYIMGFIMFHLFQKFHEPLVLLVIVFCIVQWPQRCRYLGPLICRAPSTLSALARSTPKFAARRDNTAWLLAVGSETLKVSDDTKDLVSVSQGGSNQPSPASLKK